MEQGDESRQKQAQALRRSGQRMLMHARAGSAKAQDWLMRAFAPVVAAYLRRHTGARLARYVSEEDLVQEVLLRGVRGLEHLRDDAKLEDFQKLLFQHARWVLQRRGREAGDFVGETLHGRAPILDGLIEAHESKRQQDSTGSVTRGDQARWLHTLIQRLDPLYAGALELHVAGTSFPEIAARLGIEEEAARKRVARGMQMLGALIRGNDSF